jgi:uncharacterized metal-binding protein YceD (DUF177 family)
MGFVMRYKIKDIGEAGIDVRVDVTAAWLSAECADLPISPSKAGIHLEGRLEPLGEGYLLRGKLAGELTLACARCLEPAPVVVESPMAVTFVEKAEEGSREEREAEEEEEQDDVVPFEHGVIDVGGAIRDEILLSVPMSAVCREDCAGICPSCGCNRNLTPCACAKRSIDSSKLGALAKIKLQ